MSDEIVVCVYNKVKNIIITRNQIFMEMFMKQEFQDKNVYMEEKENI